MYFYFALTVSAEITHVHRIKGRALRSEDLLRSLNHLQSFLTSQPPPLQTVAPKHKLTDQCDCTHPRKYSSHLPNHPQDHLSYTPALT
jgi:hypothetical protein